MTVKVIRTGATSMMIDAPTSEAADLLASVIAVWRFPAEEPTTDLGDLTEYNAARAALAEQRDYWQQQISDTDISIDPDARAKIDSAIAQRDLFAALMRATARGNE